MKERVTIFILFLLLLGCKKSSPPNITLSTNLTNCPASYSCAYNYYDHADFTNIKLPVQGNYRVFWYNSLIANGCGKTMQFYFKTSLTSSSFDIDSSQIANGQIVAQDDDCSCCMTAFLTTEPIGGEIKGKRIDATRWLVNASIIFVTIYSKVPADTLVVNQYFTLEKIP